MSEVQPSVTLRKKKGGGAGERKSALMECSERKTLPSCFKWDHSAGQQCKPWSINFPSPKKVVKTLTYNTY